MKIAIDVAEMFGEDVRHLHGNLFRVRRSRIRMARAGLAVRDGRLVYGNPRWFMNKEGSPEARGLESSKMEELRLSIQNSGLDNPIRLRPVEGDECFLEVVNGERRFRCIESLCDTDADCHDSAVGDKAPASEVYEWVDCRIEELDDREALGIALKTNETSEVIGDLASIQVVKTLRDAGYDDQDILIATGKSTSWLRETDRIIGLDEVCLGHFESDQITRKAALQLALIENAEDRIAVLESVVDLAKRRHESKLSKLGRNLQKAEAEEEVTAAAAKVAMEIGDEDEASELQANSRKASKKADKAREEHGKASSRPAKADARDVKKVSSPKKAPQPAVSLVAEYLEMIESVIANEGFDSEGDSYGIDLDALTTVCGVVRAIAEGEEEIMDVLATHCPLPMDEEIAEETDDDEIIDEDSDEDSEDDEEEMDEEQDSYDEDYEAETPPELEKEFQQDSRHYEYE